MCGFFSYAGDGVLGWGLARSGNEVPDAASSKALHLHYKTSGYLPLFVKERRTDLIFEPCRRNFLGGSPVADTDEEDSTAWESTCRRLLSAAVFRFMTTVDHGAAYAVKALLLNNTVDNNDCRK